MMGNILTLKQISCVLQYVLSFGVIPCLYLGNVDSNAYPSHADTVFHEDGYFKIDEFLHLTPNNLNN